MLSASVWNLNQPNTVLFVLIDSNGDEVTGLGSGYTLELSKAGAAFSASAGTKSEIGSGWYKYISTVGEADTSGPIALKVTGVGIIQQNLEYAVDSRVENTIEFTYTLTSTSAGTPPIPNAEIAIYADGAAQNLVWTGETDLNGIARDSYGQLPRLVAGTYFIWRSAASFVFSNPDEEAVNV